MQRSMHDVRWGNVPVVAGRHHQETMDSVIGMRVCICSRGIRLRRHYCICAHLFWCVGVSKHSCSVHCNTCTATMYKCTSQVFVRVVLCCCVSEKMPNCTASYRNLNHIYITIFTFYIITYNNKFITEVLKDCYNNLARVITVLWPLRNRPDSFFFITKL